MQGPGLVIQPAPPGGDAAGHASRPAQPPRGFTLIELLVVIAIIALLVSILVPSLSRARALVRLSVCLSQKRSVALAAITYTGAWDGWFPPIRSMWYGAPTCLSHDCYRPLVEKYGLTMDMMKCPNIPYGPWHQTQNGGAIEYLYTAGTMLWFGGNSGSHYVSAQYTRKLDEACSRVPIVSDNCEMYLSTPTNSGLCHPVGGGQGWIAWTPEQLRPAGLADYEALLWGSNEVFGDGHGQFTQPEEMEWDGVWFLFLKTPPPS